MKRYLPFITLLVCAITSAQNINDVLRYSTENLQGTARFQSMSGAFGALGGDLSALNANPAGSAVFNHSIFTVSGTNYNKDNTVNYNGTLRNLSPSYLNINQAGGALVFKSTNQDSGWSKFTLAFNYDTVENYENEYVASGRSNQGIDTYFLDFAQGVPFGDIEIRDGEFIEDAYLDIGRSLGFVDQQAFLGVVGGIINPTTTDANNTTYNSNAIYNSVNQQFLRITSGQNNKFTLNAASAYENKLYIGASLNFHSILYDQLDEFTETGYDSTSEIQRTIFDNRLHTEGAGFSFNVGAIAKLNNVVRIGASYQSPTWYRLTDELAQRIDSDSDSTNENINFINFNIINQFESYTVKTPAKLTGSLALIFGKNGLLSLDYGYQDMSQASLSPNNSDFDFTNENINSQLGSVTSVRVGGEFRIQKISLRGGYRFEGSPYENGDLISDLEGISAGIGYNFGGSRLDFSINRSERDIAQTFFDSGITDTALINTINTNATLSYTLNF